MPNIPSRATRAVSGNVRDVGTQTCAWLLAIGAGNGKLLWKTQLESPANVPFAIGAAAPVVVGDMLFTGVASLEAGMAAFISGHPAAAHTAAWRR